MEYLPPPLEQTTINPPQNDGKVTVSHFTLARLSSSQNKKILTSASQCAMWRRDNEPLIDCSNDIWITKNTKSAKKYCLLQCHLDSLAPPQKSFCGRPWEQTSAFQTEIDFYCNMVYRAYVTLAVTSGFSGAESNAYNPALLRLCDPTEEKTSCLSWITLQSTTPTQHTAPESVCQSN